MNTILTELKTQYEFIHFEKWIQPEKRKTSVWECLSNRGKTVLGVVAWYPGWRQYCFYPYGDTVFSASCMRDIVDFMENLRKSEQAGKP